MTTGERGGIVADSDARRRLDETMTQFARQTAATLHVYQHPGQAIRRVGLA